ncbi:hypothetical protein C2S52_012381 [Perilla frutescens var. hirtella]|nr:hypothetical protein C2S52_012381 [Perilla frutescens var. hirtella]
MSGFLLWKCCNSMVKEWLTVAMDKEIRNSVKHTKTTHEIWTDLEERFEMESAPKGYGMTSIQSRQSPKCMCGKCTCNVSKLVVEKGEKERIYEFLMGLYDVFNTIKTQILSTKPMPSLRVAYHLVAKDEQQQLISTS